MKRRVLLKRMAALGSAGAVAGCLGESNGPGGGGTEDGGDDGGDGGDATPTETPTATPTETPTSTPTETPTPTVASEAIETEATDCLTGDQTAAVAFEADAVVVDGSIQSPDPCHEATLETVAYDPDADRLTVGVGVADEGGACQSCLGVVEYRAEIDFEGALPGHVTVEHVGPNGKASAITEASR
jgi:hypothetical protein